MKPSSFIAILLTLIMAILVLAASLFFLFPRQQALQRQMESVNADATRLRQTLAEAELSLNVAEATRDTAVANLATTESNAIILEGELVAIEQTKMALEAERDQLSAALAQDQSATATPTATPEPAQPPFVAIVSPEDGAVLPPGAPVPLIVVAQDEAGVMTVNVSVDDEPENNYAAGDTSFYVVRESRALTVGAHVISAWAINSVNVASEPVSVTLQIQEVAGSEARLDLPLTVWTGLEKRPFAWRLRSESGP